MGSNILKPAWSRSFFTTVQLKKLIAENTAVFPHYYLHVLTNNSYLRKNYLHETSKRIGLIEQTLVVCGTPFWFWFVSVFVFLVFPWENLLWQSKIWNTQLAIEPSKLWYTMRSNNSWVAIETSAPQQAGSFIIKHYFGVSNIAVCI